MKIDLSKTNDIDGAYQNIDFSEIRKKYNDPGTKYCFDVLDGRYLAGYMIKLACFRHLRDLQRIGNVDFQYVYELDRIRNFLKFESLVPNVDNIDEKLKLMPWQEFIFSQLMGWRKPNGSKRFTTALLSVARGQGKTMLCAMLLCYTFLIESDGLSNQDYLVASLNYKQTTKLFGYVCTLLKEIIKIQPFKNMARKKKIKIQHDQIVMKANNNVLRAISFESGKFDSYHFRTAVTDEIGEITSREKMSKISSGQVKVFNHQLIQISTSYPDATVPFHTDQKVAKKAMEEDYKRKDDNMLCLVWSQDSIKETEDPKTWFKSNPLLYLDSQKETLLDGLKDKRESDLAAGNIIDFQNKNLNLWLNGKQDRYIDLKDIESSKIPKDEFNIDGRDVYIGFDASQFSDDTAFGFVFPYTDENGKNKFHIMQYSFIPTSRTQQNISIKETQDGINYRDLEKQDYCQISHTPGGDIDYETVYNWLLDFVENHDLNVKYFLYDPWNDQIFIRKLEEIKNWPTIAVRQGTKSLSQPTTFMRHEFQGNEITMFDDDILSTALLNAVTLVDNNGIKIDKNKATQKIDAADAIIDAFYAAIYAFEDIDVEQQDDVFAGMSQEQIDDFYKNYSF